MAHATLVIGGTGHIGHLITQKLVQHGGIVRVLARDVSVAQRRLDAKVEVVAGDITQASIVTAAMRDVNGCVIIVESDHGPPLWRE